MWDGGASFVDRMDSNGSSFVAEETRLNIAGGIQPKAFRQAFKDPDDPQGIQARFLYAIPQIHPAKRVKGYCQLSDILPAFYDWCDACPQGTIKLSREADVRYSQLVEQIGRQTEKSPSPALRAWMRKLPSQLLRIALGLHMIHYYYDKSRNFWELQVDILERAAQICRYYRNAFQVVQEKSADSNAISSILLKIWDLAATQPEGLSPRDIYRSIKAISRRADELGRRVQAYTLELLGKLVEMGKGTLEKKGRFYRFFAKFTKPKEESKSDSQAHTLSAQDPNNQDSINQAFQNSVTVVTSPNNQTETGFQLSPETVLSPVTVEENAENVNWLIQLLTDLEQGVERFQTEVELTELMTQVEDRKKACHELLIQNCPDYEHRLRKALENARSHQSEAQTDPEMTIEEIKPLLLACRTFEELNQLKQAFPAWFDPAYDALTQAERRFIDSLQATRIEAQIYQYEGDTIDCEGQVLEPGDLVYVDPYTVIQPHQSSLPVWIIKAIDSGWQQTLDVSRQCLVLVEQLLNGTHGLTDGQVENGLT